MVKAAVIDTTNSFTTTTPLYYCNCNIVVCYCHSFLLPPCLVTVRPLGTCVLVHTHADVDKSNTSYYGATGLFLLSADGAVSVLVPQSKDGPVYDVKWNPDGNRCV